MDHLIINFMKKLVVLLLLIAGCYTQVTAQEKEKFRFDIRLGYAAGNEYGDGVLFNANIYSGYFYLARLEMPCYSSIWLEGSHRGLVRAPAKRLGAEMPLAGSNPAPSAIRK